ncbi:MAG: LuxR C-terminal-related transcriptional regulator, partial [Actinobacteria bacterium]|nr:LuxR C-terminal-related transcriptional regulator [Actinomycetota bacterium]
DSLLPLGRVTRAQGDRRDARRLVGKARDMASSDTRGVFLQELGELAAEEGAPEDARRLFEEALGLARVRGAKQLTADALYALGELARAEGEHSRAAALHDETLGLRREIASAPEVLASLEAIAGLAAEEGDHHDGARLLGVASALREQEGYARLPWEDSRYEAELALVQEALSAHELDSAFAEGTALSLEQAAALALNRPANRNGSDAGWESLTQREREVAALAAEGLTNPGIAKRLVISPDTVKTHLSRVFSKLGVTQRKELARHFRSGSGGSH